MKRNSLRDESTSEGRKIWQDVDQAASHAPEWVVSRIKAQSSSKDEGSGMASKQARPGLP